MTMLSLSQVMANVYHHTLLKPLENRLQYEFQKEEVSLFSELIISWNASRPIKGEYAIHVSLKTTTEWSPWLLYALWGTDTQLSFSQKSSCVQVFQDTVETMGHLKACGFKIRIEALDGANLNEFTAVHICAIDLSLWKSSTSLDNKESISINLPLQGLSQMQLLHPRKKDMCSPTAMTAVLRYLRQDIEVDPLVFAKLVHDDGFDIYGNWVLNVAEAYAYLGKGFSSFVARLNGFNDIYEKLHRGIPVIISVKGPLKGSALPYSSGHLLVVTGFDAESQQVICMDPAFLDNQKTLVRYDLHDLMQAWNRRKNLAYCFEYQTTLSLL